MNELKKNLLVNRTRLYFFFLDQLFSEIVLLIYRCWFILHDITHESLFLSFLKLFFIILSSIIF